MNKKFKQLQKENESLRKIIFNSLPIGEAELIFRDINKLIENEIEQEKFCNV